MDLFNQHWNQIAERQDDDLKDILSYASRWTEQAWRIALCLHCARHGEAAASQELSAQTATDAIAVADWFAHQQLRILEGGRYKARRAKWDEVLELLTRKPSGITATDIYKRRIAQSAAEAHALLAQMEAEGELTCKESKPASGGHITKTFTKAPI